MEYPNNVNSDGWDRITLESKINIAARIGWRGLKRAEYTEEGPLFLSVKDIQKNGEIDYSKVSDHISDFRYEESPEIQLHENDILITKDGTIGKVGFVSKLPQKTTVNSSILVVRPDQSIDSRFLFHYFRGPAFQEIVKDKITGSAVPHLFQKDIKKFEVIIPPLDEQHRIVAQIEKLLTRVEAAKERLNQVPTIMQQFRQSVLAAACSGRLTEDWRESNGFDNSNNQNSDIPPYWKQVIVKEICDCIVPNRDKPKSFTGNFPWVTLPDIPQRSFIINSNSSGLGLSQNEIQQYRARIIPKGSVIMSCVGKFGISVIVGQDLVVNQQFHAFLPSNKIIPHYLLFVIRNNIKYFEKTASATTISYLNKTKCNKMPVPLPPLEEQQEIIRRVNSLFTHADRIETQVVSARSRVETITQSILHQAFTGRLA